MISFSNLDTNTKIVLYDGKFVGNLEDFEGEINFKGSGLGTLYRTEIIRKYKKEYHPDDYTTKIIKKNA